MHSNQVIRILQLFMHLICTILGHNIANNHSIPICFHPHFFRFTWLDFRVKHVRTYVQVCYIVFPIFLMRIWMRTLYK